MAEPPPIDSDRVAAAWRMIRADPSIQFNLPEKTIPPREPMPEWLASLLRGIGRFVTWVGGGWQVLLWIVGILIVAALLVAFVPGLRDWLRERFRRGPVVEEPGWVPAEASARALLEDADALADAGRFGEAVHLLLFRSIDDIVAWRGDVVRRADTSRDIARADALPPSARGVFAGIVAAVERSLFGGAQLGQADWDRARADYAGFALGQR
jgi:hypothetical protein